MMKSDASEPQIEDLIGRLLGLADAGRRLVAVAGPPGSGKSTLADRLCSALNMTRPGLAAVIPMDGFHFDDAVLAEMGALSRKGAPHTFDVGGLKSVLDRLRANEEDDIAVPIFDRHLEISRAGGRLVPKATPLLIVEGNYLLLDMPPWSDLRGFFDLTVKLEVSLPELERRLIGRWLDHGLSKADAQSKTDSNDLPNAETVVRFSQSADVTLIQG